MTPKPSRRWPFVLLVPAVLVLIPTVLIVTKPSWLFRPPPTTGRVDPGPGPQPRKSVEVPKVHFTDITKAAGIHFRHTNGSFGRKLLPETMGGGVAFLDFDNDGKQDLLFVNSCYWPGYEEKDKPAPTLALYRNKGNGEFEDVTKAAGLDITMYGMGVTAGDFDNDGWIDVFITGVGGNRLFHNEARPDGGRHFVDVTASAGVGGPGGWPIPGGPDFMTLQSPLNWSTSAAFLDYDGDGLLDLFVCNYVTWSPDNDLRQPFQLVGAGRAFGPPTSFEGAHCFLYRNLGGGHFEDASVKAGIPQTERGMAVGKSLGVCVCDVDDDGWPDIVVANDTVRNFFFHNKRDGTFEEIGVVSGVAWAEGKARGAMGIDWGWYRCGREKVPGRFALLIANFADEPSTFLRLDNPQRFSFTDAALAEGLAGLSRQPLKFGAFFFDFDLDGRQDLLTANGHLEPDIGRVQAAQTYEQPAHLFWNSGTASKCFEPVTKEASGPDLFVPLVGRGSAYADIDGNGTLDVVLMSNGGPARLLRNEGGTGNHWVRLVLEGNGVTSNRSALGARVTLEADGVIQRREVTGARGYLSQSELPVTFGLGKTTKIGRVTIQWPGANAGPAQVLEGLEADQVHVIRQPAP
jgi:enediyne biosynthesis protein E4